MCPTASILASAAAVALGATTSGADLASIGVGAAAFSAIEARFGARERLSVLGAAAGGAATAILGRLVTRALRLGIEQRWGPDAIPGLWLAAAAVFGLVVGVAVVRQLRALTRE